MWLNVIVGIYAALNIGFGWAGFALKQSIPSLIAGNVAGLLLIATILIHKTKPRVSRISSLVIALLLIFGYAGPNSIKKHDMYAEIDLVCSVIVVGCLGYGHMSASKVKKSQVG